MSDVPPTPRHKNLAHHAFTFYLVAVYVGAGLFVLFADSLPLLGRIELALIGLFVVIGIPAGMKYGTQDKFWT